ncbi:hypothetical protein N866_05955 [Actinotalea ferrariae CF5-4]|uniref:DUF5655 domain-containing protein n=1 Tax=Actinotalea ferrariae CF5-4 TaxID=948458 RepID=A0A021VVP6_9CELL|nr:DUF5655 domain-containing protein [Actinotalea ferrariae]EYR65193.1 hypothetical protein N866_05955 [Actinotalea ferrariae CF5-4]
MDRWTVEDALEDSRCGLAVHEAVLAALRTAGPVEVHPTRTQVAYRRRRAFAWLWWPGRWLRHPTADVVLTVSLGRVDDSPRWKEVVHPTRLHWVHHLEVSTAADVDAQVAAWLREAYDRAG